MAKIITIYCEGKRGSHDFDILDKVIGDIVIIKPIGGKRGANAIIEFIEKGVTTSDFYLFFRDRDFDCGVPSKEELYFDGDGSGHLPSKLDLEYCQTSGWTLIQDVVSKNNKEWTEKNFKSKLDEFLELFNDKFFAELKFLIYYQGKDFAKALTNKLSRFPLKDYYKFAKKHFDYKKFTDLVELRGIVDKEK